MSDPGSDFGSDPGTDQPAEAEAPPTPTFLALVAAAVGQEVSVQGREDEREVAKGLLRGVDAVGVIIETDTAYRAVPWSALRRLGLPPPQGKGG